MINFVSPFYMLLSSWTPACWITAVVSWVFVAGIFAYFRRLLDV